MRELPLDERARTLSSLRLVAAAAAAAMVAGRFGSKYRDFTSCDAVAFFISVSTEAVDLSLVMCRDTSGADRRCTAEVDALRSGLMGAFCFLVLIAIEMRSGTCDFDDDFIILPTKIEKTLKFLEMSQSVQLKFTGCAGIRFHFGRNDIVIWSFGFDRHLRCRLTRLYIKRTSGMCLYGHFYLVQIVRSISLCKDWTAVSRRLLKRKKRNRFRV